MGGGTPRACATSRATPRSPAAHSSSPPPLPPSPRTPSRHSCAPSRHSCAGRNQPTPRPPLFPNSSLPPSRGEVRWGVGRHERAPPLASHRDRLRHSSPPPPLPPPSLRPLLVIPAQAGTNPPLFPNSSLPPSRGEVRWGVGAPSVRHQSRHAPIARGPLFFATTAPSVIPAPLSAPLRPFRHSCALSVIPAQAGTRAAGAAHLAPNIQRRRGAAQVGRRSIAAHRGDGGRPDSCLRRNDGWRQG